MSKPGELRALTGARGIAAWLVVFYHLRHSLPPVPEPLMALFQKGYLAVDFFFVLSGFVIALSWRDRIASDGWAAVPTFLKRRFARVWPLHALVLSAGVALALLLWATGRHVPADFPFGELPLHYLLIQNWGFTSMLAWNVPAWSISAEAFAYLLFPLLAMHARVERWPLMAVLAAALAITAAVATILALRGVHDFALYIPQLGLMRCMSGFAVGTLVFELWRRYRANRAAAIAARLVAVAALAGLVAGLPETIAAPIGFAALVLWLASTAGRRGHPLEAAVVHRLGEWSYATYLAHYLMWKAFKLAFVHAAGPVGWPLIGLYLATVLVVSALLYRFVELPAQAWINRGPRAAKRWKPSLTRSP